MTMWRRRLALRRFDLGALGGLLLAIPMAALSPGPAPHRGDGGRPPPGALR